MQELPDERAAPERVPMALEPAGEATSVAISPERLLDNKKAR